MKKKFPIFITSILIMIILFSLCFKDDLTALINNYQYKASLSAERQEVYDKMKIEYVNIKNRVTGTAPFNEGTTSDENGIDVSDKDDYVRTFDMVRYTLELGIAPNTSMDGVTDASTFKGGVIKVKAKLPNQGDVILMTWEQDAWMQNVSYNSDKTEIYAEYHVPSDVSVTNANQSLSFSIKIGGYKKEITSSMMPEFEVWMEGNQPDNETSDAVSVNVKDSNSKLYISGRQSYDIWLTSGTINHQATLNNVRGNYVNIGIAIALVQFDSKISDLRGVEYPDGELAATLDIAYRYKDIDNDSDWTTLDGTDQKADGILNGTSVVAVGHNFGVIPGFWPSEKSSGIGSLPYGKGSIYNTVVDSGNVTASITGNQLTIKSDGYVVNERYPDRCAHCGNKTINEQYGYFISSAIELFVPYYDDGAASYNYSLVIKASNLKTTNIMNEVQEGLSDQNYSNNSVSFNILNYLPGTAWAELRNRSTATPYWGENGYIELGNKVLINDHIRMMHGPYEGGEERLITWQANKLALAKYNSDSWYSLAQNSISGFDVYSFDNVKVEFGVYKENPSTGLTTLDEINTKMLSDFDWYSTYEEAAQNGVVTALHVDDPDNKGYDIQRHFYFYMEAINNTDNIGTTGALRVKRWYYDDAERTKKRLYLAENTTYRVTEYDSDGNILSVATPENCGETLLIIGNKTGITTGVTDLDSNGKQKTAYDVQEGVVNIKVSPTLTNGKSASDTDAVVQSVIVKSTLPDGLTYVSGSANKEPKSITFNSDGTTTIIWEYNNWQVNHSAPDYPTITYVAELSSSLENNTSLTITSTIFTEEDLRDEKTYRTGSYGIVISNLAGSRGVKKIDKQVVDANESFTITSSVGNTSQEALNNVKTIEILATNGDANGSKFSGTYTIKINSLASGQKIYYTTKNISAIGLTEDKYGKLTIKEVDLATDDRWIEVNAGETIPSNATAMATQIDSIAASSSKEFVYTIIPTSNKQGDIYAFTMNITSDNLAQAVKSNTVISRVVERNIEGLAFIDVNRNNIYDTGDTLLKNNVVKLLDSNGTQITTTQTDANGKYIFENVEKGNYYVEFSIPSNYELISKNGGEASVSSVVNANKRTDLITGQNESPTKEVITVSNINLGIRKIDAQLIVHHYIDGTTTKLADDQESTVYYGDTYTTGVHQDIPNNYELKSKSDNFTGTVSSKNIEVIYYYQKKDSSLETSITKTGPEEITKKDEVVEYKITYTAKVTDYIGDGTITIVDTLPHKINLELSNLDDGTYDEETNTITWIIPWNGIDSFNNLGETTIEKNISLVYSDILPTERIMINSVKGSIKLDNNSRDTESQTSTNIKVPGTIIVHHYIKDTEVSLGESVTTTDLVGESYTSSALDLEGYIITKPEAEEYIYTEEEQIVIYYYEKIKVHVTTQVDGIGGTILGDEDVEYGDDSTKDKIVIKPDDGYVLGEVIINGERIELDEDAKSGLVLDNFHEMKEDMNIVVKFIKVVDENPNTGAFVNLLILLLISVLTFVVILEIKRYKKLIKV